MSYGAREQGGVHAPQLEASTLAGGAAIAAAGEQDFSFLSGRIEGQFIWSVGSQVITVNLHAVDLGGHCEVRGTAEHATV